MMDRAVRFVQGRDYLLKDLYMAGDFHSFVKVLRGAKYNKSDQAACFIWWAEHRDNKPSISMNEICAYFEKARLAQPNRSRLEQDLRETRHLTRDKIGRYQLTHDGVQEGNLLFETFRLQDGVEDIASQISVKHCPYIGEGDIADARKMADVYLSLFCLENSVRRHIEKVLSQNLGDNWWEIAASSSMKRKEQDRRSNEEQNKWIPSRSNAGPLYSLDWPDLVTLMRKYEDLFKGSLPDTNFLYRFSDLGNLRNVVAHNGVIEEPMQFRRIELALHDWTKQIQARA
jgi:hypothetical protein